MGTVPHCDCTPETVKSNVDEARPAVPHVALLVVSATTLNAGPVPPVAPAESYTDRRYGPPISKFTGQRKLGFDPASIVRGAWFASERMR